MAALLVLTSGAVLAFLEAASANRPWAFLAFCTTDPVLFAPLASCARALSLVSCCPGLGAVLPADRCQSPPVFSRGTFVGGFHDVGSHEHECELCCWLCVRCDGRSCPCVRPGMRWNRLTSDLTSPVCCDLAKYCQGGIKSVLP